MPPSWLSVSSRRREGGHLGAEITTGQLEEPELGALQVSRQLYRKRRHKAGRVWKRRSRTASSNWISTTSVMARALNGAERRKEYPKPEDRPVFGGACGILRQTQRG
jgi:hypothetical protein